MGTWNEYDLSTKPAPSKKPACYAIYMDGRLVYVGQTTNVRSRLYHQHKFWYEFGRGYLTPWGRCFSLKFKVKYPRRYGEWLALEARLIRRLRPAHNRRGMPNV